MAKPSLHKDSKVLKDALTESFKQYVKENGLEVPGSGIDDSKTDSIVPDIKVVTTTSLMTKDKFAAYVKDNYKTGPGLVIFNLGPSTDDIETLAAMDTIGFNEAANVLAVSTPGFFYDNLKVTAGSAFSCIDHPNKVDLSPSSLGILAGISKHNHTKVTPMSSTSIHPSKITLTDFEGFSLADKLSCISQQYYAIPKNKYLKVSPAMIANLTCSGDLTPAEKLECFGIHALHPVQGTAPAEVGLITPPGYQEVILTVEKQGSADITVKSADGTEVKTSELIGTPKLFASPPCEVGTSAGMTINLGNYSSARFEVSIKIPCAHTEIGSVYDFAEKWVGDRMNILAAKVKSDS